MTSSGRRSARLVPVRTLLDRRRRCCGVRWPTLHRQGCRRHPWAARLP
ncbi:MAG TPA: hypothetical protein VF667_13370 [Pseudonocardia sp.]